MSYDIKLLSKALTIAPVPTTAPCEQHLQLLQDFNQYAKSLRIKYIQTQRRYTTNEQRRQPTPEDTLTSFIHRRMRFLSVQLYTSPDELFYSGIPRREHYIELNTYSTKLYLPNNDVQHSPDSRRHNKNLLNQLIKT